MAIAMEEGFDDLDAPVLRVTDENVPLPTPPISSDWPDPRDKVVEAARKVCYR
jgi:pyruvate dehydrogenase E1 component beta subunit